MVKVRIEYREDLTCMFKTAMRDEADKANYWLTGLFGPGRYNEGLTDERAPWHKTNPHLTDETAEWKKRDMSQLATVSIEDVSDITKLFKTAMRIEADRENSNHPSTREQRRREAMSAGSWIEEGHDIQEFDGPDETDLIERERRAKHALHL